MIEEQVRFERWRSKVDLYLEQMVKKLSSDFRYDYLRDFKNNITPEETATRVIKRRYRNGVENDSTNIRSKSKRPQTPR